MSLIQLIMTKGVEGINVDLTIIKLSDKFRGVGGGPQKKVYAPMNAIPWTHLGPAPPRDVLMAVQSSKIYLPKEFSWTNIKKASKYVSFPVNKSSITEPVNQGCCGSCWAWSTVTALADRYALANNIAPKKLSPSIILSCCNGENSSLDLTYSKMDMNDFTCLNLQLDSGSGGCQGGFPYAAALQCIKTGAPIWTQTQKDITDIVISDSDCPDMNTLQRDIAQCLDSYDSKGKVVAAASKPAPHYISADVTEGKVNAADYYVNSMKRALLKGPIVGTYMVLGDFMAIGKELDSGFFTWDKTGGVYVPGAPYSAAKTKASTIIKMSTNAEKLTVVKIMDDEKEVSYGNENKGFHSVVIVGWGLQPVEKVPKGVKTIDGKIPYWIIRNSWGKDWPIVDGKPYYDDLPPGYWKHAMRTKGAMNPSLGIDQPFLVKTEDNAAQLAGATLVFYPKNVSEDYHTIKPNGTVKGEGKGEGKGGGKGGGNWWQWLVWSLLVAICLVGIIFCVYNKWPMKTK